MLPKQHTLVPTHKYKTHKQLQHKYCTKRLSLGHPTFKMSAGLRAVLFFLFCIFDDGQAWTTFCVSTSSSEGCRTLDNYVENQSFFQLNDVKFDFEVGRHYLHSQLVLDHSQTNLTLAGVQGDGQVVIHCPVNASFVFKNVVNLSLFNLTIECCGHLYQWHTHSTTAALVFLGGRNILIQGVTFNLSLGAMHFENVTGEIQVSQSTFYKSSNPYGFITAACKFRFLECSSAESTSLDVTNSHFIGNNALVGKHRGCHKKNIQAGGAVFSTYCPDINVTFDGVVFHGNKGCFGGGLTLNLGSTKERFKNQVQIRHSSFSNNYALYGAAAVIDIYYNCVQKKSIANLTTLPQLVYIHDTNFTSNTGKYNGGALYIRHKESSKLCTAGKVIIEDCKFIGNSLHTVGGVAIFNINYLAYSVTPHVVPQFYVIVTGCQLEGNYLQNNSYGNSGSGAIITEYNPHFELHNTSIVHNKCSGVVATASNVIFRGNVEISHNLASSGGGVVLCSGAIMYFSKNAQLTIAHNNALHLGGGILVEYACQQAKPICFFQHLHHNKENTTAVVNMVNNNASRSGSNLYGGSVDSCIILKSPQTYDKVNSSRIFDKLFNTAQLDPHSITSTPTRACFCNDDVPDCRNKSKTLEVAPGGDINVKLILVGQRFSPTPGNLAATPSLGLKIKHSTYVHVSELNATCTNVMFAIESDRTKNYGQIKLSVSTTSDISFTEHLKSYMPIWLEVVLMPCSFGFIFKHSWCGCKYLHYHKIHCNSSAKTFKTYASSLAWLGSHRQKNITYLAVSDFCPPAFCHHEETIIQSEQYDLRNQDGCCQKSRTGILCGACTSNASLILGSNDCVENCSYRGLFLILLFLVLGVFLVLFLTLFDLTVAEGTIGGILFYANVVQINSDVYFSSTKFRRFSLVCKTFIAWLNLDFGIPVCFYSGMNSYDKTWFQYLFPLYIWLIAGAIIFASKKNIKIAALLRSNCIKVLSTLILLSYAKMTRLTMEIFRYHRVYLYPNQDNQSQTYYKWALDGKMDYFSHEHLPLFVAGVVTAVVLAPYTMCLLFMRRLYKHSNYRILWWINKWRPFFDTYVGSYNEKWYCWTGVQLLARIIVLVANEAQSKLLVSSITTLVVVLLLLAMQWWGELKVYRKRWLNLLEGVSLLNLAFLQLAVVYSFKTYSRTILPYVSVVLTMVLFVGVVIYHGYRQLFSSSYFKERARVKLISNNSLLPPLSDTEETESFPTDSGNGNTSRLSCFFVHDREPLLVKDD